MGRIGSTTVGSTTPLEDRDLWSTPPEVYDELNARYGPFTLDAAANLYNHKTSIWLGPDSPIAIGVQDGANIMAVDALCVPWRNPGDRVRTRAFCNPPYSRGMVEKFIGKARLEALAGRCTATLLVPATTDTIWWHTHVWDHERNRFRPGVEVEFWPRRIQFVRPDGTRGGNPPGGSAIITFYG